MLRNVFFAAIITLVPVTFFFCAPTYSMQLEAAFPPSPTTPPVEAAPQTEAMPVSCSTPDALGNLMKQKNFKIIAINQTEDGKATLMVLLNDEAEVFVSILDENKACIIAHMPKGSLLTKELQTLHELPQEEDNLAPPQAPQQPDEPQQ